MVKQNKTKILKLIYSVTYLASSQPVRLLTTVANCHSMETIFQRGICLSLPVKAHTYLGYIWKEFYWWYWVCCMICSWVIIPFFICGCTGTATTWIWTVNGWNLAFIQSPHVIIGLVKWLGKQWLLLWQVCYVVSQQSNSSDLICHESARVLLWCFVCTNNCDVLHSWAYMISL